MIQGKGWSHADDALTSESEVLPPRSELVRDHLIRFSNFSLSSRRSFTAEVLPDERR